MQVLLQPRDDGQRRRNFSACWTLICHWTAPQLFEALSTVKGSPHGLLAHDPKLHRTSRTKAVAQAEQRQIQIQVWAQGIIIISSAVWLRSVCLAGGGLQ